MFFSKAWNYSIRALIYLAEHKDDGPILRSVIAEEESIPSPFLAKILGTLASVDIIDSTRGPRGGFVLKADPDKITLLEIAQLIEHFDASGKCLLGYGSCERGEACPIHEYWAEPKQQIMKFLKNTTLSMICQLVPQQKRIELKNN
ncbi:MAG: Rrf2 family transcriptional regulator [Calditrichaeota bacterium]|jgi:Rrf2 family transcriptional regulator, iron-sulfur cluster assembly transcription factor|nr:Rrf2 family transcriptional regulator [Calditrichota bacterium]MBT7618961.1 Rrf2 family transcriptional regulator [Calditrichota bacterium]MBT7787792.1 Rrf2 family transcriptional regulator [Calditrichota bacterium]